ncbi:YbaB/EbfC family nucleoid-associated protein [Actinoallomurus sp. NBC_01490]|uniref:YbaB/EbfC family nucleoid-associated protein n=1 Tax=Actinoallomurus sp. NBC_01490 TaxID=2903557 RepID=UPI002E2F74E1|nr:YbaB/EbfC family nucleoid-associated protein [Actinoallomurus sp. NBC_01490]
MTDQVRGEDTKDAGQRAEAIRAWIEQAQAEADEVVGVGEAESGQVTAKAAAGGRVTDIKFGPRALRLDSKRLADAVRSAVGRAQRDAAEKVNGLMRKAMDGFDPAETQAALARISQIDW